MAATDRPHTYYKVLETAISGLEVRGYSSDFMTTIGTHFRVGDDMMKFKFNVRDDQMCIVPLAEFWNKPFNHTGLKDGDFVRYFKSFERLDLNMHIDINELLHKVKAMAEDSSLQDRPGCRICAGILNRKVFEDEFCMITAFDGKLPDIYSPDNPRFTFKPTHPDKMSAMNKFCWWPKGNCHRLSEHYDSIVEKFDRVVNRTHVGRGYVFYIHVRQNCHFHVHFARRGEVYMHNNHGVSVLGMDIIHAARMAHKRLLTRKWDHKHALDIHLPVKAIYDSLNRYEKVYYLYTIYMFTTHYYIEQQFEDIGDMSVDRFLKHPNIAATMEMGTPVMSYPVHQALKPFYPRWPAWVIVGTSWLVLAGSS
jgi:hypothetical protein